MTIVFSRLSNISFVFSRLSDVEFYCYHYLLLLLLLLHHKKDQKLTEKLLYVLLKTHTHTHTHTHQKTKQTFTSSMDRARGPSSLRSPLIRHLRLAGCQAPSKQVRQSKQVSLFPTAKRTKSGWRGTSSPTGVATRQASSSCTSAKTAACRPTTDRPAPGSRSWVVLKPQRTCCTL